MSATLALCALVAAPRTARADDPRPSEFTPAQRALYQYAAGAAVSLVAVPASVGAGTMLGRASNDLVVAALPAALTFMAVPTFGVTLAEVHVGNVLAPGSARLSPAIFAALGVDLAALALGAVGGVSTRDPVGLTLFTVATSVVMPGFVTLTLHFTQPRALRTPPPAAPVTARRAPRSRPHASSLTEGALDAPAYALAPAPREQPAPGLASSGAYLPLLHGSF